MRACDVLYRQIHQLVPLTDGPREGPVRGEDLGRAAVLENAAIATANGVVLEIGPDVELAERYDAAAELDLSGYVVVPGFVDAHTHPVFAKTRENEFLLRCRGADYVEIAKQGGGILSSVRALREIDEGTLEQRVRTRIERMLACGTTTIEAKSGYGLDLDSERKSLEILQRVGDALPITVSRTMLAAHEVAPEYRDDRPGYVELLCSRILPELRRLSDSCDIFVEEHVFGIEDARRICLRARELGYRLRLHVDELSPLGGTELAVEVGAASADHLARISERGIEALAASDTTAMLLPGTIFFLDKPAHAPGRQLADRGAIVALATDFNPGSCYTWSLPMIATLARIHYAFTPQECLNSMTRNPAFSLGLDHERGTLHEGKACDFVALDLADFELFGYEFGDNPVALTVKDGRPVALNTRDVDAGLLERFSREWGS
ncbi:MAG: imidazolonepropionase [Planctomycetes bacterium]|nr:imidazolonepropionase [Planctomycetota bacterium]